MEDRIINERTMKVLVQALKEENHSLVIGRSIPNAPHLSYIEGFLQRQQKGHLSIFFSDSRGVFDLFRLLHEFPDILQGALLADKVVGKGVAAIMALGKVGEVYAEVISEPALELLVQEGIRTTYGKLVPNIINREQTGLCPVETRCLTCKTPVECLMQIETFFEEVKK